MNIKLLTLSLQCRQSREVVDFSQQITYIHGQISAGKSSIMRLIDFCLGGDLERTPAISQELVSVALTATIGDHQVVFEREAQSKNLVQITWQDSDENISTVLAPIKVNSGAGPLWSNNIYNLSDMIFYLADITPIRVRRSKQSDDSPLVRLSFRDIMWYCYLDQDHLDSSFYRLKEPFRQLKSRDAMRFFTGYYTERMNELEIELDEITEERLAKIEAAKQIRAFLDGFGYGSEHEIERQIDGLHTELQAMKENRDNKRQEHQDSIHFTDTIREQLRLLGAQLDQEVETLADLHERIDEQESLRAELLSAKFKLARAESATSVLAGVKFQSCPSCGTDLDAIGHNAPNSCGLCGSSLSANTEEALPQTELIRRDLTSRVEDLDESISRHKRSYEKQQDRVEQMRTEKGSLDLRLSEELANYDSLFLANTRELDRDIATFEERIRNLQQTRLMYQAVTELERQASHLKDRQVEINQQLEEEKRMLSQAEYNVETIENSYRHALISIGVPGVTEDDSVEINRRTWIPWITPSEGDGYTFYNAGSGGKKTLLNVSYALALHEAGEQNTFPLPKFLMIDTPMKNIGEDVNEDIFRSFYMYLYGLADSVLRDTQFIIVDKEYFEPPEGFRGSVVTRYMTPDNPLISYYRGA